MKFPMKFRKRHDTVDAMLWDGTNFDDILAFMAPKKPLHEVGGDEIGILGHGKVLEVYKGDWIIKDIRGEFYPCKSDIFYKIYEPAS